jgi:hypothetical protein
MGNWYQNVTLKGPSTDAVVGVLADLGRRGFVTPRIGEYTVVYDAELDRMDRADDLADLPATLSVRLGCPALVAGVYDDDALYLALFEGLDATFEYFSAERLRRGVRRACRVFGRPSAAFRVGAVLMLPHLVPYLFESFRHLHFVRSLGLPEAAVFTGYGHLERGGEAPPGVGEAALIRY